MYKLYYNPGSASMAPHAALEEIGAPYELVLIDTEKGEHHSEAYRKIQPHSRVPALVDGDLVMYESAAILMYLCDRYPEAGLAPAIDSPERALYLQWVAHLTNTVQEALMHWHHPDFYAPDESSRAAVKAETERRLDRMWAFFDGVLARPGPYLLGERFSAADLFFTMLTRWTRNMAKPATTYENVRRCAELVRARPAYQRMMRAEGIS